MTNYQLSIINYQLSIINYQLSIINYQLSMIGEFTTHNSFSPCLPISPSPLYPSPQHP